MTSAKRFILPVLLVVLSFQPDQIHGADRMTIVDLYRKLPGTIFRVHRHAVTREKEGWKSLSTAGYEIEPLVDLPHGYLKITDHGTGGGTEIVEIALFITTGGGMIVGLNQSSFDSVIITSWLGFYRYDRGSWEDVTGRVLPDIPLSIFMDKGASPSGIPDGDIAFIFTLPRHGTTVTARIDTSRLSMKYENGNLDPADKKRYAKFLKGVRYREVDFPWDLKSGRFSVGKKR